MDQVIPSGASRGIGRSDGKGARPEDKIAAQAVIQRYRDKTFSMTAARSFVVMERLGTRFAFRFDDDFAQYGLQVRTPDIAL